MKIKKKVTEKKLAANRQNAMSSTGPRTELGRSFSRFNAVRHGLFARHVVIPNLDADPELFAELFADVTDEFSPVGSIEGLLVVEIAESLWKIRRATVAEQGIALSRALRHDPLAPKIGDIESIARANSRILEDIQQEIDATGTLSINAYNASFTAMQMACPAFVYQRKIQHSSGFLNTVTVDDEFLEALKVARQHADRWLKKSVDLDAEQLEAYYRGLAIPDTTDMERIFRYGKRAKKDFDRALKTLIEYQALRRKSEASGQLAADRLRFVLSMDPSAFKKSDAEGLRGAQRRLKSAIAVLTPDPELAS